MANVKHNKDIQNEQDLQNLVIGIIFRMNKPFTKEKVISLVNYYLKGSSFYENMPLIEQYVSDNLDFLQVRGTMRRRNGICYMRNPISHTFDPECYETVYVSEK